MRLRKRPIECHSSRPEARGTRRNSPGNEHRSWIQDPEEPLALSPFLGNIVSSVFRTLRKPVDAIHRLSRLRLLMTDPRQLQTLAEQSSLTHAEAEPVDSTGIRLTAPSRSVILPASPSIANRSVRNGKTGSMRGWNSNNESLQSWMQRNGIRPTPSDRDS